MKSTTQPEKTTQEATKQASSKKAAQVTKGKSTEKVVKPATEQEKYLRLYAEFENYKRRALKDRLTWVEAASQKIISTLLPILEDFERAITTLKTDSPPHKELRQGVQLIYEKFFKVLAQQGLSAMQIAKGDTFNPDYHEALTQKPTKDDAQKGKIIQVVAKGYLLHDKVIRIAKVIIGI